MFDRVHCQPRERLRVGVTVVELVHVGVDGADVQEPVRDVEVHVAPHGKREHPKRVEREELRAAEHLRVGREADGAARPQPNDNRLPKRPLHDGKAPVPRVMQHVAHGGHHTWLVLALRGVGEEQLCEEEAVVSERHGIVQDEALHRPAAEAAEPAGRRRCCNIIREDEMVDERHREPHEVWRPEHVAKRADVRSGHRQAKRLRLTRVPRGLAQIHPWCGCAEQTTRGDPGETIRPLQTAFALTTTAHEGAGAVVLLCDR